MSSYSRDLLRNGEAIIRNERFDYGYSNDWFYFTAKKDLSEREEWRLTKRGDLVGQKVVCVSRSGGGLVAEFEISNCYIDDCNSFRCACKELSIHDEEWNIDGLRFTGPTINQLVQSEVFRKRIEDGANPSETSFTTLVNLMNKPCHFMVRSHLANPYTYQQICFMSSISLRFESRITPQEAFIIAKAFINLISFLSFRRDIFFHCETFVAAEGYTRENGEFHFNSLREKEVDITFRPISIDAVWPIIGELLGYALEGKIVPIFIPAKRTITFSDSFILATAWAQMVFKQVFVPMDQGLSIEKYTVKRGAATVYLKEQLTIMIKEVIPYIQNYHDIEIPILLGKKELKKYLGEELPERVKTIRHALAHGSENPKDYTYTEMDMVVLLCSIYHAILTKKFGLDGCHLKLALSELFFDIYEISKHSQSVLKEEN